MKDGTDYTNIIQVELDTYRGPIGIVCVRSIFMGSAFAEGKKQECLN